MIPEDENNSGDNEEQQSAEGGNPARADNSPQTFSVGGFDIKILLFIGVLLYGLFHQKELGLELPAVDSLLQHILPSSSNDVVDVSIDEPSAEMKRLVEPIGEIMKKGAKTPSRNVMQDCIALGDFYYAYREILLNDPSNVVKTTGQVRQANIDAGTLMFSNRGIKGEYSGLGDAVDAALKGALGDENKALDKDRARQIFGALAWQFYKSAKEL